MPDSKAGGYISQVQFKNGDVVDLSQDDIVVFVGPNNAGKSQCLRDIYDSAAGKQNGIVISDVVVTKYDASLGLFLNTIARPQKERGGDLYNLLNHTVWLNSLTEQEFRTSKKFNDWTNVFVTQLDTSARLTICDAAANITRSEPKRHPIHYAAFDPKYRKWLSDNFKKAFDVELTPNTQYGARIPLCMGDPVKLEGEFEDEQSRMETYAEILATYKQVHQQGDGVKSFTGILLHLMLDYRCIFLIDEPEAFLHPPQAKIMGQVIGETLSDQKQAFISTHSEEIIKGLLEVCPGRVKIVRITRQGDENRFSILNNRDFADIWNDPLLKYSNIMSSLFHKTVVLCESDSDCKMYSIVESHIKQQQGSYSETLFIHCGGKHRMAKISSALRALKINVKLIPDIDVLNDEGVFRGIVEAFGCIWDDVKDSYKAIVSNLHSDKEKIERSTAKVNIDRILSERQDRYLSEEEIKSIQNEVKIVSKWKAIKRSGKASLPAGDATNAFNRLDTALRAVGIYVVPEGELECFIKEVGGHGPEWSNSVLEQYPDLNDAVYTKIKTFIQGMNL